ncbi:hypothetical protein [Vibrio metoecus]|uniref:hypothetical protein n=1 Tax=Vibrio metoecus TaxID=1481663 RepID=UPI0001B99986|nr:hypothetical protein [Vibrio metoecus]EEX66634.1 hypothetical protein VCJ_001043 [Vibrio metoecus]
MKKSSVLLAMFASMAVAPATMAGVASFQWNGEIPSITTDSDKFWIVVPDGQTLLSATNTTAGKLVFRNNNGVVDLLSSTEFGFKVVKNATVEAGPILGFDPTTDVEDYAYKIQLTDLQVSQNGEFLASGTDYFGIHANNTALELGAKPTDIAAGKATLIKVAKVAADNVHLTGAEAGSAVIVSAKVAVTTTL